MFSSTFVSTHVLLGPFKDRFSTKVVILVHCNALVDQYSIRTAAEQSSDAVFFLRASCISADPIMRRALLSIKQLQIKEIHGRGDKSIKITCGSQRPWVWIQFFVAIPAVVVELFEKTFVQPFYFPDVLDLDFHQSHHCWSPPP